MAVKQILCILPVPSFFNTYEAQIQNYKIVRLKE